MESPGSAKFAPSTMGPCKVRAGAGPGYTPTSRIMLGLSGLYRGRVYRGMEMQVETTMFLGLGLRVMGSSLESDRRDPLFRGPGKSTAATFGIYRCYLEGQGI